MRFVTSLTSLISLSSHMGIASCTPVATDLAKWQNGQRNVDINGHPYHFSIIQQVGQNAILTAATVDRGINDLVAEAANLAGSTHPNG
ncbi:hypothetical protein GQ43DRAFT_472583 [Delitschia confertaspora ATCC 74209]|uniref:Uncharacterized protein n=1 Tax=Delitschia confertaspora ATCC 74209 TaxID=1513339 RepID=A0A9P4JK51_9PLEO|nr:hypothetical protein GQ43DRAFT_472583 [Delitschia confertaspora ATCC 74209]